MGDPILVSLPSIHVTLVGFFGAILCGFGVYALQKIHDLEDARARLVKDLKSLVCGFTWINRDRFADESGAIRWDVVYQALKSAFNTSRGFGGFNSSDDVKNNFDGFLSVFSSVYMMYPFASGENADAASISAACANRRCLPFDEDRTRSLQDAVEKLRFWSHCYAADFRSLGERYGKLKRDEQLRMHAESLEMSIRSIPHLDSIQEMGIRERNKEPVVPNIDYAKFVDQAFSILNQYEYNVLPRLIEMDEGVRAWKRRFPFLAAHNLMIFLVVFILFFGVFLPPLILWIQDGYDLCVDYGVCWSKWYSLILLVVTAAPYFCLGAWWAKKKYEMRR